MTEEPTAAEPPPPEPSKRRALRRLFVALAWALALYVVVHSLAGIARFQEPLPYWDHWELIGDLPQLERGDLRPLFAPHNEHLVVWARLCILADQALDQGRGRLALLVIVLTQFAHAALLIFAASRTPRLRRALLALAPLALVCAFSAIQAENLVWHWQTQFVGVFFCANLAFACATLAPRTARWWSLSLALAVGACFQMANGALAFPLLLLIAWRRGHGPRRLAAGVLVAAVVLGVWLTLGVASAPRPSVRPSASDLPAIAAHALYYLGNVSRSLSTRISPYLGFAWILLGFVSACALFRRPAPSELVSSASPPPDSTPRDASQGALLFGSALMAFVLGTALLTAAGRFQFTLDQALSSRYATGTLTGWFALVALTLTWRPRLGAALGVCLAALLGVQQEAAFRERRACTEGLRSATTAALSEVGDLGALGRVYPNPLLMLPWVDALRERRLGPFADPVASSIGASIDELPRAERPCLGRVELATPAALSEHDGRGFRVSGWAYDEALRRAPTWILLVDEANLVVGVARSGWTRSDVQTSDERVGARRTGWRGHAKPRSPRSALRAFALVDGRVAPLRGSVSPPKWRLSRWGSQVDLPAPPSPAAAVASGAWTTDLPVTSAPLPAGASNLQVSWASDDRLLAEQRWTLAPGQELWLLLQAGPANGAVIEHLDLSGASRARAPLALPPASWTLLRFRAPTEGAVLRLADEGSRWGEWLAIAAPPRAQ